MRREGWKSMMALAAVACMGFAACTSEPISSTIDDKGGVLKMTVRDKQIVFDELKTFGYYDTVTKQVRISGETFDDTNPALDEFKQLVVTFNSDLDAGTFPRTIGDADSLKILYGEYTFNDTLNYGCLTPEACTLTIEGQAEGHNIHGTFSGTLTNLSDSSDHVTVTGGDFGLALK